ERSRGPGPGRGWAGVGPLADGVRRRPARRRLTRPNAGMGHRMARREPDSLPRLPGWPERCAARGASWRPGARVDRHGPLHPAFARLADRPRPVPRARGDPRALLLSL